jgi:hypothetical protein
VAQGRAVAASEALRDELSVMVGIGNAVAERILEAAATQKPAQAAEPAKETSARRKSPRKPRSRTASGRRKPSAAAELNALADVPVAGHA